MSQLGWYRGNYSPSLTGMGSFLFSRQYCSRGVRALRGNIVLIGFMGSGKSSVGSRLAKELGYQFIDMDKEIERTTQMDIPSIFKQYGEQHFRSLEKSLLKSLSEKEKTVISTGGGTAMLEENWQILSELGLLVNLFVTLDTAFTRTGGKGRPILQQDRAKLEDIWEKRQLVYQRAEHTVDTEGKSIEEILHCIVDIAKKI